MVRALACHARGCGFKSRLPRHMDFMVLIIMGVLPGIFGGFVRGLVGISKSVLGSKKAFSPSRLLFTLIVSGIVGGVAASLSVGDWRLSLLVGYAGSDFLEGLIKTRILKGLHLF